MQFGSHPYPFRAVLRFTVAAMSLLIPNRTFLVRFGGISGEFGRAMVRILARRSRAKIPMARPNEPDMPPKRTKKVRLGIITVPKFSQKSGELTVIKSARRPVVWPRGE